MLAQTFQDVTIEPGPTLNVVLGPNGARSRRNFTYLGCLRTQLRPLLHSVLAQLGRAAPMLQRTALAGLICSGSATQGLARVPSSAPCAWAWGATQRCAAPIPQRCSVCACAQGLVTQRTT